MLHTLASTLILATEAGEEEGGEALLFPETSELIAGVIAFGIIFFFVWKWVLPTLKTTLENRQEAIKSDLEAAEAAKVEAESLREDYRQQLAAARDEANQIVEGSRQAGESVKADIVARAEEEAESIKARAQDELAAERDRASAAIRREVVSLSLDVAEKVVGESLDRDAQQALVDRYIEDLGGAKG
jgi:F-type H+-transporting ATPase subunit b